MNTVMISGDGITDSEFAQIGGPGVEGTLMTFGPEARKNPNAKDVVAEFVAKGFDPEAYTLYSYAAVQIIKQAAEKAKSLDPKKVAEVMHSGMPFHTVLGDISYDKKGDRSLIPFPPCIFRRVRTASPPVLLPVPLMRTGERMFSASSAVFSLTTLPTSRYRRKKLRTNSASCSTTWRARSSTR